MLSASAAAGILDRKYAQKKRGWDKTIEWPIACITSILKLIPFRVRGSVMFTNFWFDSDWFLDTGSPRTDFHQFLIGFCLKTTDSRTLGFSDQISTNFWLKIGWNQQVPVPRLSQTRFPWIYTEFWSLLTTCYSLLCSLPVTHYGLLSRFSLLPSREVLLTE